jgi:chemotaxis protein histidine kinase CheA
MISHKSDELNLDYLKSVFSYLYGALVENVKFDKNIMDFCVSETWHFLFPLFNLDFNKNTKSESRKYIIESLKAPEHELVFKGEIGEVIFINLMKGLEKEGESVQDLLTLLSKIIGIDENEVVDYLVVEEDFSNDINSVYLELKKHFTLQSIENLRRILNNDENKFLDRINYLLGHSDSTWFNFTKKMDVLKVIRKYTDLEEEFDKSIKPQVFEILSENFNHLNVLFEKEKFNDHPLYDSFKKLLDVPVKYSFTRFKTIVKEISESLGKKVQFRLVGDQGSLNRDRLSLLQDALVHLVRNSLDHGIESPDKRVKAGKNETGTIEIKCFSDHNQILEVSIRDDGKGIDPDYIAGKSMLMGRITEDQMNAMTRDEKINLIFQPNFTTKEKVSEISGRGVGMEVVKKNLETIGSTFHINSEEGIGTEFIIKIDIRS